MKSMRLTVALLLPLACAAQNPPAPAAPDAQCAISGQVVNAVTAEPLRRALVNLRRIDAAAGAINIRLTHSASTDSAGRFAISGIDPGRYNLQAERSGFIVSVYGARGPGKAGTPLILERGQTSTDLLLRMTPHSVIAGRVLDQDGEPVTSIEVQVSRLQYMGGRKQLARSAQATTNDLGEYRVFGLAPGRYYLNAFYRPNPMVTDAAAAAGEEEYVTTYYPRTPDPLAAAPLDVTPGSQLHNIDVTLAKLHTVTVRGHVTSELPPVGEAFRQEIHANVNVMLNPQSPLGVGSGNSRGGQVTPQGAFEFRNVAPGSYQLVAVTNVPGKAYTANIPLQVGAADIDGVSITIHAGVTVAGHAKVDGETSGDLGRVHVGLQPFEPGPVFGPMPDQVLKPDGSFHLPDVSAGRYRVTVNALPDGFYVKSIRSSNVDVLAAGLDVASGAPAPLEIVLGPNAGQLTGTVLDPKTQKAVPAVTVVLVPAQKERRNRESLYRVAITDQAGHFTLKTLVPGDYMVFSWEDVPYGSWMDPEFLAPQETRGQAVTISEGSPQSIQVTLIVDP